MDLREIIRTKFGNGGSTHTLEVGVTYLERLFPRDKECIEDESRNNPNVWCLTDGEREQFLSHVSTAFNVSDKDVAKKKGIQDAMRRTVESFDDRRKASLAHREYNRHLLGRVVTQDSLERTIGAAKGNTYMAMPAFIRRLLKTDDVKSQIRHLKRMCDKPIGLCQPGRLMWVWFNVRYPNNPYHDLRGVGRGLLRRLGLVDEGKAMIVWVHDIAPGIAVRYPTVLDAALNPQWRPGGRSFPIGNREGDPSESVPEAVHDRIGVEMLREPIIPLEKL